MTSERATHFGFSEIDPAEKAGRVGEVFSSVASRYDLMNDLMSFGSHRLWKDLALARSGVREGHRVLDVAAGSGDMTMRFARQVGTSGQVVMTDINASMLACGRSRLLNEGLGVNVQMLLADAESLPFSGGQFDCVSIAFGLRNVTRIPKALASMSRLLKPGGRLVILEFSTPTSTLLSRAYDLFSFSVIPSMGKMVTGDEQSYQYLVESIRKHPNQQTLSAMMEEAGLEDVKHQNINGGIVAIHTGYRF
ncbi:MAG: bifunctional demethylmenaquinone methyltransferase/2-methoxy-6-polyprenyl-1,4-benzoquinol methylase UbiE [Proteobacteria bacterium]|nr:bifunctional demethylmenaquinone methyltransferase/2-methoxy-6-polyprenyl-1,4-benzoquinol methylase UbiE [Pseudomonadota bacterium]MBT4987776.1 bifunctional demethylmenaquinone methyltransferase/2-methoxy-6-polyprenyl-1,4-benzoquinol methylase UbiE [Pseudomonadota bacterium]MBT5189347.1 bifunctional demethylmenaquinone methyltransferase/2-methoxy-6-polyprenyl-1,4-benzoquinol methylase UbiE [Pseudomonadota bacterium]MBT5625506.1 bifunctional demethylmenaquinone methyltransferase/2-methoxy-6-po